MYCPVWCIDLCNQSDFGIHPTDTWSNLLLRWKVNNESLNEKEGKLGEFQLIERKERKKSPKFRFESAIRARLQWNISRQSSRFQHPLEEVCSSRAYTLDSRLISATSTFFNYFVCFFLASASHNPLEIMDDLDRMKRAGTDYVAQFLRRILFLEELDETKRQGRWSDCLLSIHGVVIIHSLGPVYQYHKRVCGYSWFSCLLSAAALNYFFLLFKSFFLPSFSDKFSRYFIRLCELTLTLDPIAQWKFPAAQRLY